MGSNTVFEKIINREIPGFFLFENKDCIAILDVFPLRDGHTLVIPTKPHSHIQDMTSNELKELMIGVKQAQEMLGQHFDTEDFTVAIHDGPLAGQEIPHTHSRHPPPTGRRRRVFATHVAKQRTVHLSTFKIP